MLPFMSEVPLYCLGEGEYLVAGRVGRKRGLYVEGWIKGYVCMGENRLQTIDVDSQVMSA